MPLLSQLSRDAQLPLEFTDADPDVQYITDDSRKLAPNSLFVAIRGTQVDSHQFIAQAAANGAAALLVEENYTGALPELPVFRVRNTRRALARLLHAASGFPAAGMRICGVTGTNGKTTLAFLMESIYRAAGCRSGMISTVEVRSGRAVYPSARTTYGPVELCNFLREMREQGVNALSMEVSSHGIEQDRIDGLEFECGILTNVTHDHLDYHGTLENYAAVKRRFFAEYVSGVCVLNLDDAYGRKWARELGARALSYGAAEDAGVRLLDARTDLRGTQLTIEHAGERIELQSPLRGQFNVSNLLAATAAGLALDLAPETIQAGVSAVNCVPGRFEVVEAGQPFGVVVDYAHTPDALERLLGHAKKLARGRLVVIFGAGGDRDKSKRAPMGRAVGRCADWIIVTNDNPRNEDPAAIAHEVCRGVMETVAPSVTVDLILDRRAAIYAAIEEARSSDLILIAGKGHEQYEMIKNQCHPFDDRQVAREAIAHFRAKANSV